MRPFRVTLEGSWSPKRWNDIAGFFATRIVLAENPDQAAEIAQGRLLGELSEQLPGCPEPKIRIDIIDSAEAEQLLESPKGFTFYSNGD